MDGEDEEEVPRRDRRPRGSSAQTDITLLYERQRGINRRIDGVESRGHERLESVEARLDALEKKQSEVSTMLNKGLGAAALLMGIGAFIGWVVSVGGNVLKWIRP